MASSLNDEQIIAESIIEFWYSDRIKPQWFNSSTELDQEIHDRFQDLWQRASQNKCDDWTENAEGSLALIIILDQFPLNMFRGKAESFKTEAKAIEVAKKTITNKYDKSIEIDKLAFLYMPLMHSENIQDQDLAVDLFEKAGLIDNWKFAKHHRDLILEFGRFPHRNVILQRESTEDEINYLNSKQAFKG